jgi:cytochrome P450
MAHPLNPDIDLVSGEFWGRDPHPELTWLRENAPVYFDGRVWGIASHAGVREVSLRPGLFCSGQGIRPDNDPISMFIETDGEEHTRRRKLVNRGFTPRRLADSEQRITEICEELIDAVADRTECDAVADLAAWLPMHVIGDMLDFPRGDRSTLLKWSDDMVRGYQLLTHPEQKQRLIDDPSLIPAAVFDDPFTFDIARAPNDHLAFGLGAHFCLGSNLARLELRCFFETLLRRLPGIELADKTEPACRPANFVSGYETMPVTLR